jgi:hypothetical protein
MTTKIISMAAVLAAAAAMLAGIVVTTPITQCMQTKVKQSTLKNVRRAVPL